MSESRERQKHEPMCMARAFNASYEYECTCAASAPSQAQGVGPLLEEARIKLLQHLTPSPQGHFRRVKPEDVDWYIDFARRVRAAQSVAPSVARPAEEYDVPFEYVERQGESLVLKRHNETTGVNLSKPSEFLYLLTGFVHPKYRDMLDEIRWELEKRESAPLPTTQDGEQADLIRQAANELEDLGSKSGIVDDLRKLFAIWQSARRAAPEKEEGRHE